MQDDLEEAQIRVMGCLKDFLMWLTEYIAEKNPEILKDMGFVGHLERTKAAVETHLGLLEREIGPKSRNATGNFKSRRNSRTQSR